MFSNPSRIVKISDIERFVSQEQILMYYYGIKVPCKMPSIFRPDEKHPSMVWNYNGNSVTYIDFGDMSNHGDVYEFLSRVWSLSLKDTLYKIWSDLKPIKKVDAPKSCRVIANNISHTSKHHNSNHTIQIKSREWKSYDKDYWESYGCNFDTVKSFGILPIQYFWIGNMMYAADKLSYCYPEHKDGVTTYKVYQPFNTKNAKWFSNHTSDVWFFWTYMPKTADNLVITSSAKDALNIMSNMHIPSIALQGEGYSPKPKIMDELKSRFKNIYVFFDNDFDKNPNPGQTYAAKLCDRYGLINIVIPSEFKSKDPSDLYKNLGKDRYMNIMNELFYDGKD